MVFKRSDWNELIAQINALVPECDGVTSLNEVDENHIWAKSDIRTVHDKLTELCEDNQFSEIPDLWKQSLVDEITTAIANGVCCCEEEDRVFPGLLDEPPEGFAIPAEFQDIELVAYDWAGWLRQSIEGTTIKEIVLPSGAILELVEGGSGWVGRQYKRWEMLIDSQSISSGAVLDGTIVIGSEGTISAAKALDLAIKEERAAFIQLDAAQVNGDPELIAEAQAELDEKTMARQAAEGVFDSNPEPENSPWDIQPVVEDPEDKVTLFAGGGTDFQQDFTFEEMSGLSGQLMVPDEPDSPTVVNGGFPAGSGIVRLYCDYGE